LFIFGLTWIFDKFLTFEHRHSEIKLIILVASAVDLNVWFLINFFIGLYIHNSDIKKFQNVCIFQTMMLTNGHNTEQSNQDQASSGSLCI